MPRNTILLFVFALFVITLAGTVYAVPPWELETPVFVTCPSPEFRHVSTCLDEVTFDFQAVIPNQPGARGRLRYHLISGPGDLDEKSGRWTWRPTDDDLLAFYDVEVAASIHNTDIETSGAENCRFGLGIRNTPPKPIPLFEIEGLDRIYMVRFPAPVDTLLPFRIEEPDFCETPSMSVQRVMPEPAGMIEFVDDTVLHVKLDPADQGRKFEVHLETVSGPHVMRRLMIIETRESVPLEFTVCPAGTLEVAVRERFTYQLRAVDTDYPNSGPVDVIFYSMLRPTDRMHGAVNYNGLYYFVPRPEQLGEVFEVEVVAFYGNDSTAADQNCRFWVEVVDNVPPEFVSGPCGDSIDAGGLSFEIQVEAIDPDSTLSGGEPEIIVEHISPPPNRRPLITYNGYPPRTIGFYFDAADAGRTFTIGVGATDRIDTAWCYFTAVLSEPDPPNLAIQIDHTESTLMGGHEFVDITVTENDFDLYGFDLQIAYDARVASFQQATPGSVFDECGWEYFTYRYGPFGGCDPECPSGLLRLIGIAETNNGAQHPSCFQVEAPFTLATLDFLVTTDRTYECTWNPIKFFWTDCEDNSVAVPIPQDPYNDQRLLLSKRVFNWFDGDWVEITDGGEDFPTYEGIPTNCIHIGWDGPVPLIDFYNGGIDVACADSIDDRGDINLNGISYEIADWVLYRNFFVYGPSAFEAGGMYDASVAASDINADGIPTTIEDLVYMARIIVGDALPSPPLGGPEPDVLFNIRDAFVNGILNVSLTTPEPLGAVWMLFEDSVGVVDVHTPIDVNWHYSPDENVTRIIVHQADTEEIGNGDLLTVRSGSFPIEVVAATYDGSPVNELYSPILSGPDESPTLPEEFALHQNHPNPFNLETTISFDLPAASEVELEIFNVTGQRVYRLQGNYAAGQHQVTWTGVDGSGATAATGVYYYRITAGGFVDSKKMVILK